MSILTEIFCAGALLASVLMLAEHIHARWR